MQIEGLEYLLWVVGCVLNGALCLSIYLTCSYRALPFFSLWMAEAFLQSSLLFLFNSYANARHYREAYWTFNLLEIVLQVVVAFEFADKALRQGGSWVRGTKLPFLSCVIAGTLISLTVALRAHPAAVDASDFYYTRVVLLISVLMFLLAVSTLAIVYSCGSLWKPFYLYRFSGFLVWSAASAIIDTMHVYWRMASHFSALEAIRVALSEGVVLYWILTSFYPRQNNHAQTDVSELEVLKILYRSPQKG